MEINIKCEQHKKFMELDRGTVFKLVNGAEVYMKVCKETTLSNVPLNAVNLSMGYMTAFNQSDMVVPFDAELNLTVCTIEQNI